MYRQRKGDMKKRGGTGEGNFSDYRIGSERFPGTLLKN